MTFRFGDDDDEEEEEEFDVCNSCGNPATGNGGKQKWRKYWCKDCLQEEEEQRAEERRRKREEENRRKELEKQQLLAQAASAPAIPQSISEAKIENVTVEIPPEAITVVMPEDRVQGDIEQIKGYLQAQRDQLQAQQRQIELLQQNLMEAGAQPHNGKEVETLRRENALLRKKVEAMMRLSPMGSTVDLELYLKKRAGMEKESFRDTDCRPEKRYDSSRSAILKKFPDAGREVNLLGRMASKRTYVNEALEIVRKDYADRISEIADMELPHKETSET